LLCRCRRPTQPRAFMHDLNSALVSCSLRKSPGPSGLRYEHWRFFHPKVLQALTTTLSQEFWTLNTRENCSEFTSNLSRRNQEIEIYALYL
jgi:hypothetical protein